MTKKLSLIELLERGAVTLTRDEKIDLWAKAIEKLPTGTRLPTLMQTEYAEEADRAMIRAEGSPLSVAAADPTLRAAGLTGDTYGDGMKFFELSDQEMHRAMCYCLYGETMDRDAAIARVRALGGKS